MSKSVTSRTAVYGPVSTVVWQGSVGDRRPYADQVGVADIERLRVIRQQPGNHSAGSAATTCLYRR